MVKFNIQNVSTYKPPFVPNKKYLCLGQPDPT